MLVEDNPIDIFINTRVILQSGLGANVFSISNGLKAIDYLKDEKNLNALPDIILLDIRMPEMDGFEFLEKFSELEFNDGRVIRIILLSSSIDPSDYERARKNPLVLDYIPKPLTKEKLLAIEN